MTDAELTHLILVLDRSGSMKEGGKATEAEKGVRALVDEQVALPGRLEISVARFDNVYELLATAAPAVSLDRDLLQIEPRGMTALFDAVGRTVTTVGANLADRAEEARPGRVVVLVATDGLENASTEYTSDGLRQLIDQQTKVYGWEFMFMGTSQDAVLQAVSAGFDPSRAFFAGDSAAGVASAYGVSSGALRRARITGTPIEVTEDDRSDLA